jgi:opacity protein-like surface antigen
LSLQLFGGLPTGEACAVLLHLWCLPASLPQSRGFVWQVQGRRPPRISRRQVPLKLSRSVLHRQPTSRRCVRFAGISGSSSEDLSGFVGGGQVGGNYQIGSVVVGLEADFDYSAQSKTTTLGIFSATDSIPWIGTLRGRLGYALDRVLIYATAGGAEGKFSSTVSASGFGSISGSKTHGAWTVGGGAEVGLTENLSARLEYLYLDTGNINLATTGALTVTGRVQDNLIRAGLNWRFPL